MREQRWRLLGENISQDTAALRGIRSQTDRSPWLQILLILAIALLLSRAFFLQVVLGTNNRVLAEGNRIEVQQVVADRGVIEDRNGRVLARNGLKEGQVIREYPFGEVGAHILGYVGVVSPDDYSNCPKPCLLSPKTQVGKMGIEKEWDEELRGSSGQRIVETEASGREVRVMAAKPTTPGQILKLNLDIELSTRITQVLAAREKEKPTKGAVVVSRAGSNEVLALVSWPGFDPNLFTIGTGVGRYRLVEQVLGDNTLLPLFNRAISGVYPPGSTYKLVTAAAALEGGQINATTLIEDTGEIKVGEFRFGTWNFDQRGQKEGWIGLVRALARSNDIFFYNVGERVGVEQLRDWSQRLGLGRTTQIELGGEASGLVPDPVEKERQTGERWFLGNTYHLAIGQGDLLATPLQINRMTAAVISGFSCPSRLIASGPQEGCKEVGLSSPNRQLILEGMKQACSPGGTAFPLFNFQPQLACKTGTAQHGGEKTEPHAWITVVLPDLKKGAELEQFASGLVMTVLLEEAGEGSYEAGPVAAAVVEAAVSLGY